MRLKCLSINICGIGTSGKCHLVSSELFHLKYDLFLSQETHVPCKEKATKFARLQPGKCFWSFGTGKAAGVAVLTSPNFPGNVLRFVLDSDGHVLSVLVSVQYSTFNIVNIYAPNTASNCKVFFQRLHDYFISHGVLIIGRHFNCVHNSIDKFHLDNVQSIDKASLCSVKSAFSLLIVWRKQHPRAISFTWSNSNKLRLLD